MRSRLIATVVVLGLLAAACSSDTGSTTTTTSVTGTTTGTTIGGFTGVAGRFDPGSIQFVAALQRFDACDAVLDHFRTEAASRVGPYGLNGGGGFFPQPFFAEDDMAVAEAAPGGFDGAATTMAAAQTTAGARVEGQDFSGSNVQVVGVDEPDIIKTDGTRIITVVNNRLTVTDADAGRVLGTLFLDGSWGHRLFVRGDRVFVFSDGGGDVFAVEPVDEAATSRIAPPQHGGPMVLIQEVDISDPLEMDVVRSLFVEGRLLSARSIDGTARVVISSYPAQLPFVYPSNASAEDFAEAANRQIVAESTLETWMPDFTLTDGNGAVLSSGLAVGCDRMHRPAEFAGFDTLSVLTVDLDSGLSAGDGAAVIAQGETVYASTENLYVATTVWVPEEFFASGVRDIAFEEKYETAIHKFSIAGDGPASYEASGSVTGSLLSQFSLDEFNGDLRVAVTDGPPWGFREETESYVKVLRQDGDRLVEIGSVGEMGRGERIFSVRFVGETAYVVTFRQTDPFYVVDLSDPENPSVAGELKIPGYSAYLHPIGGGKVLGVGQDATDEGRVLGSKVTLFDVSDPANPVEVDTWTVSSGSSEAEWDHLAFLWWPPEAIAVLPMTDWQSGFYGAVVLDVDGTIDERGRITHNGAVAAVGSDCRSVTGDELQEWVSEEGVVVQICGQTDAGGYAGHSCEVMPAGEKGFAEEFLSADTELSETDRIEICWPDYGGGDPVIRSLVIGDTLWTLSWRSLQASDISTLARIDQVNIG